jgi:septal ring factor EnvC (AmiA/AmiB activator)
VVLLFYNFEKVVDHATARSGVKGFPFRYVHFSIEDEKWVSAPFVSLRENSASLRLILLALFFDSMMMFDYCSSRFNIMSDIQEKKDAVLKKLTKAQQKKLSLQEQIEYLKKEQEQILEQAKQKQNELKLKQQKLLSEAKAQERKDETRRKILLGAWVLNKLKNDESFKHQLADFEQFLSTESKVRVKKIEKG